MSEERREITIPDRHASWHLWMCNVVRLPLASASANRRSIPYRIELWASVATTGQQQQGLPVDGLATDGSILSPRGTPTTHRASLVTTSQLFLLHLVYPISRHHNTMRGVSFVYLLIFCPARESDGLRRRRACLLPHRCYITERGQK